MSSEENRVIVDSYQTLIRIQQDSLNLVYRLSQVPHTQSSTPVIIDLYEKIKVISDEYKTQILTAERPEEIYIHMANMEKELSKLINQEASEFQQVPQQFEISSTTNALKELSELMTAIDLCLAQHVREVINAARQNEPADQMWLRLEAIVNKIGEPNLDQVSDDIQQNEVALENLRTIMNVTTNLVISAITKEIPSQAGQDYINQLYENLGKNILLTAYPYTTIKNACIGVVPVNPKQCYGNLNEKANPDIPLSERMIDTFIRNDGDGSGLTIPFTVPKESSGKMGEYFSQDGIVEQILYTLINRNISVDDSGARYTPFQVELYHELIHVLHNAQGQNMYLMPMSSEEKTTWSSYEEYVTIKGGYPCEANFAVLYGSNPRESHSNGKEIQLFTSPNSQPDPVHLSNPQKQYKNKADCKDYISQARSQAPTNKHRNLLGFLSPVNIAQNLTNNVPWNATTSYRRHLRNEQNKDASSAESMGNRRLF